MHFRDILHSAKLFIFRFLEKVIALFNCILHNNFVLIRNFLLFFKNFYIGFQILFWYSFWVIQKVLWKLQGTHYLYTFLAINKTVHLLQVHFWSMANYFHLYVSQYFWTFFYLLSIESFPFFSLFTLLIGEETGVCRFTEFEIGKGQLKDFLIFFAILKRRYLE